MKKNSRLERTQAGRHIGTHCMLLLALFTVACGAEKAERPTLLISAAASLTDVLPEVFSALQNSEAGLQIQFNFAGSSVLAQQIRAGSPADVFVSADPVWMERLVQGGRIDKSSTVDLLSNELVVVVPVNSAANIASLDDLCGAGVQFLALADPAHVPAGRYAKASLQRVALWDRVKAKVVSAQDVRAALAFVEAGEADAGIVYATDAKMSPGVRVAVRIPKHLPPDIRYVAAPVLPETPEKRYTMQLLTSATARRIFDSRGFVFIANRSVPETLR